MIGLDPWWDDPFYKTVQGSFSDKGACILTKLRSLESGKLETVLRDVYRDGQPDDPTKITKFEWSLILGYLGASQGEIEDVQKRMGRVWS